MGSGFPLVLISRHDSWQDKLGRTSFRSGLSISGHSSEGVNPSPALYKPEELGKP